MAAGGIWTHHLWFPNGSDTQTFLSKKTPIVLLCNMRYVTSARQTQNQEKEKIQKIIFFLSKKNFPRKLVHLIIVQFWGWSGKIWKKNKLLELSNNYKVSYLLQLTQIGQLKPRPPLSFPYTDKKFI